MEARLRLSNKEWSGFYNEKVMLKLPLPCANLIFPMADQTATLLRELPSIDRLLKHPRCEALLARYNREYVTEQCRAVLEQLRAEIRRSGQAVDLNRRCDSRTDRKRDFYRQPTGAHSRSQRHRHDPAHQLGTRLAATARRSTRWLEVADIRSIWNTISPPANAASAKKRSKSCDRSLPAPKRRRWSITMPRRCCSA